MVNILFTPPHTSVDSVSEISVRWHRHAVCSLNLIYVLFSSLEVDSQSRVEPSANVSVFPPDLVHNYYPVVCFMFGLYF